MEHNLGFYADLLLIKNRARARRELDNVNSLLEYFPKLSDEIFMRLVEAYSELRTYYSTNYTVQELHELVTNDKNIKKTLM